ncbi:hypothetical protein N7495_006296 [Penicillium taxi]|uniref:uncharacterized protein n=1 Tax=Penicillium taxi TaxID=168475 RepID=UPI002545B70B|nr:uncharacterized protein N7495_006296 [Penicillium taxi]KAJ5894605.1 hypothetical protein N7495_006296 [Penicillium taxi]
MRFLCFHGIGTNSEIFERQTAALRYELGSNHTYDFVDGTVPWEMDKGVSGLKCADNESNNEADMTEFISSGDKTFAYCDTSSVQSCAKASEDLDRYLESEGPYDGVMAFSMGATFVLSWMTKKIREQKEKSVQLPFKLGIFFSNAGELLDYNISSDNMITLDSIPFDELIGLPTAHIWGISDPDKENALLGSQACKEEVRHVFIHERGHEVPISSENVISMAKVINRAIAQA